jgi:hypothetical protein
MATLAILALLFVLFLPAPSMAQESGFSVRVQPFEAEGSTDVGAQLASTVEQTIRLSLRLLPEITVLDPDSGEEETVELRGVVRTGGNEYEILVSLQDRRLPGEEQEISVATDSLLEIFDLADRLTEEAVRQISRRDIAFGALSLSPNGRGSYQVSLGGERFADSPRSFNQLPAGTYDITIEQDQGGELVTLLQEEVTINSGETTRVAFDLPDPAVVARGIITRSEAEYIQNVLYETSTPLSAVLDRAEAAAAEANLADLYARRLVAWRPNSELETGASGGALLPAQGARARLSSYLETGLGTSPQPTAPIRDAVDAFDDQMSAWMQELRGR